MAIELWIVDQVERWNMMSIEHRVRTVMKMIMVKLCDIISLLTNTDLVLPVEPNQQI